MPFLRAARANQHPGCAMVACHLSKAAVDRTVNFVLITSCTVNLSRLRRDVRKRLPRSTTLQYEGRADDVMLAAGQEELPLIAHGHLYVLSVPMYANRVTVPVHRPAECTQD